MAKGAAGAGKVKCFVGQASDTASFSADKIKIKGGNYQAIDTQDGYFVVKEVPVFSEVSKGIKGAPYNVTKEVLEEFVAEAQKRYHGDTPFCATAFVGHNPDVPISHPDFIGYVLPTRVGSYKLQDGEKWTVFADVKMTTEMFQKAKQGRLPYTSAEVPWAKKRITGLAFLDTQPPHFEFALFTIGEIKMDATAKFDAVPEAVAAKVEDDKAKEGDNELEKKIESIVSKHVAKYLDEMGKKFKAKMMEHEDEKKEETKKEEAKFDSMKKKPDALPVEPESDSKEAKMQLDPEFAAKFAALQNDTAELKAKLSAQENDKQAKKLVEKAATSLSKKVVTADLNNQIAAFATEAVTKKDGEAWFDKFIESLKPSLREKPPSTVADFHQSTHADVTDPEVAKLCQANPEHMDDVAKFSSQWREIKAKLGDRYYCSREDFVKNELMILKSNIANGGTN